MQNIQIYLGILFMVFYAIAFVVKKVQEQAEIKRARDDAERRRLDSLRTGRYEGDAGGKVAAPSMSGGAAGEVREQPLSHDEATRRLQELTERRRQQMEELRRRAAQGGSPAAPPTAPTAPRSPASRPAARPVIVSAGRDVQTQPMLPPKREPQRASRGGKGRREREGSEGGRGKDRRGTPRAVQRARGQAPEAGARSKPVPEPVVEVVAPAVVAARSGVGAGAAGRSALGLPIGGARSLADWRRAIMLREVLSPPLALRDEQRDVI